ncbi:MAG TPA: hypothetical protein DCL35_03050 [Candidatus Omnitrophica bacterium]|nr:hypothetical protein [Candidatus Omnitrophota bacterium]
MKKMGDRMSRKLMVPVFLCVYVFLSSSVFAQVEKVDRSEVQIQKELQLRQRIEAKKVKPQVEEEAPAPESALSASDAKTLITKIDVTGVTLLKEKEINDIIAQNINKELTVREMQKIADLITDIYRQKGYITSRAYLPPQKIESGRVEIKVVEGMAGSLEVRGNKYFKTYLYEKMMGLPKGGPFDYNSLRKGLSRINQQPDRSAKAVLAPGKEPGTTDVILEVQDRLPMHIGLAWDNYGSRYIERNRYRTTLTHNNLLGFDDTLTIQYQMSEADHYKLFMGRYVFPVTSDLKIGFFGAESRLRLGKEFEDLNARGKTRLYSAYAVKTLLDTENANLVFNTGFDYKDIFNFQSGDETSRDRLRIVKAGLDLDVTDNFGRTLSTYEIDYGIPDIMGGLDSQDARASRDGSGGKFVKNNINFIRLQKMPFDSSILWKNQIQLSPYILPAAEQFQIGGIANVRGYPTAEAVGDNGYSMTWEWSFPVYFIPKDVQVPFSKAKLYDAIRVVAFYDWANTRLRRPAAGEEKNTTLRGAGVGVRVNLPENFSAKVEFAWPLDKLPSDGDRLHTWFEVSKSF